MSLFFFLMIRRPPRSTLFPTRRSSDLGWRRRGRGGELGELGAHRRVHVRHPLHRGSPLRSGRSGRKAAIPCRSEEHTSELQSLAYLVCRLLLEKKKKK